MTTLNNNYWKLCTLEEPSENGYYNVRVIAKHDILDCPIECNVEYLDGKWLLADEDLYKVIAWRLAE